MQSATEVLGPTDPTRNPANRSRAHLTRRIARAATHSRTPRALLKQANALTLRKAAPMREHIVRQAMRLAEIYERGDAAAERAAYATTAQERAAATREVDATCPEQDRALADLVKACRKHRLLTEGGAA